MVSRLIKRQSNQIPLPFLELRGIMALFPQNSMDKKPPNYKFAMKVWARTEDNVTSYNLFFLTKGEAMANIPTKAQGTIAVSIVKGKMEKHQGYWYFSYLDAGVLPTPLLVD